MSDLLQKRRPVIRNIHILDIKNYRLPLAGVMSILHRISGAMLFLMLPVVIFLFDMSVRSEIGFAEFSIWFANPLVKIVLCGLAWGYVHHFFTGIRHLLADLHIGLEKEQAAGWAMGVFGISLPVAAFFWFKIFEVI